MARVSTNDVDIYTTLTKLNGTCKNDNKDKNVNNDNVLK